FVKIEEWILPYDCVICLNISDQKRDICQTCQKQLPYLLYACIQCANSLPDQNSLNQQCGRCIKNTPYYDRTIVGFTYTTPIHAWIKQFKFHKKGIYANILCQIYAEKLIAYYQLYPENKPQRLISVPLHWRRLISRGYNQTDTIARYLSKALNIPMINSRHIKRVKFTLPQAQLSRKKRHHNVLGAFKVKKRIPIQHIAIVDDIFTTGNTVNELAKELKKAGISTVSIFALARATRSCTV
ncbi:MAG: ComF family protein, partial [Gammaproteobacteria bacterium]|nr:ComF family protein [Gammaproteobacteria bacterium]